MNIKYNKELTQDYLKSILNYDENIGILSRKIAKTVTVNIGDTVGYLRSDGYLRTSIDGKGYMCHRLAWLYVHGEFPEEYIDHINGNKSDNRICNLREATNKQNQKNRKVQANNKTGYRCVSYHKHNNRYIAAMQIDGKSSYIGSYATPLEASDAYEERAKIQDGEFYVPLGRES